LVVNGGSISAQDAHGLGTTFLATLPVSTRVQEIPMPVLKASFAGASGAQNPLVTGGTASIQCESQTNSVTINPNTTDSNSVAAGGTQTIVEGFSYLGMGN
jgi:hypothetical protein